jgi:predicted site-specific integrase-resolvase
MCKNTWKYRRMHLSEVQRIINGKKRRYISKNRGVALYGRVSSHEQKQKGDLERQISRLRDYLCNNKTTGATNTNTNTNNNNILNKTS